MNGSWEKGIAHNKGLLNDRASVTKMEQIVLADSIRRLSKGWTKTH